MPVGTGSIVHWFYVMDNEAFNFVLGTHFFAEHPLILSLTLQASYVLNVDPDGGRESVPLVQSGQTSSYLRLCKKDPSAMMAASKTEHYQLLGGVVNQGLQEFEYFRKDLNVGLFASDKQHVLDIYCCKGRSCCYKFYSPSFRMAYGNSRFGVMRKVLTRVTLERSHMVLCSLNWGAHAGNDYLRTPSEKLTLISTQLPADAIKVPLGRKRHIGKPGWGSMLGVVDRSLASVLWEGLDPALFQEIQRESSRYTLDVLKDRLWPRDAVETTPGREEYLVSDAVAPNTTCHVPKPDDVSECGLSRLPSSIHSDDETAHDAFFVQTCLEEVVNAEYATPQKRLFSIKGEEALDEEVDPRPRLREYVDYKERAVAKRLWYARPTRRSWPLKQGSMGDMNHLKEDLEQKPTTWQPEVDWKLMRTVWGAHVSRRRTGHTRQGR